MGILSETVQNAAGGSCFAMDFLSTKKNKGGVGGVSVTPRKQIIIVVEAPYKGGPKTVQFVKMNNIKEACKKGVIETGIRRQTGMFAVLTERLLSAALFSKATEVGEVLAPAQISPAPSPVPSPREESASILRL